MLSVSGQAAFLSLVTATTLDPFLHLYSDVDRAASGLDEPPSLAVRDKRTGYFDTGGGGRI